MLVDEQFQIRQNTTPKINFINLALVKYDTMFQDSTIWMYFLSGFIGIGLAAATGFRVFLPVFAVSLASYMGWINLPENFKWLAGLPTLITAGIAMAAEILSYYIPVVDHFLDSIKIPLATVAGSVLFASQFGGLDTFPQWSLALIAGGGTAAAISTGLAGTRVASTTTTAGLGNPVVATGETVGAGIMSILAFALPILAAAIAIVLVILAFYIGKKLYRKLKPKNAPPNLPPR